MAKKSKKGFRIPKEIAGVKVPKEARRAGEALIEKANSPAGRQALASGIAMAATAAAAIAARQARGSGGPKHAAPDQPGQGGTRPDTGGARAGTTVDPHQMADAVGQAASAFMAKMFAR
ncbi:hypothetical protein F1C10_07205 [Sphingomonas sp. NBWT7]|uniref:hypothetical protein n=1 Tax=Sphingomonas sp. NBWT7 TaxID=2596913 RepID=UPI001628CF71|nr:hypothetical protein [Sphingomonas sp. NBWT7]QNE31742.1 hypothetical protein F1C10_07205 [Sphingomonas sp. NBWT7]